MALFREVSNYDYTHTFKRCNHSFFVCFTAYCFKVGFGLFCGYIKQAFPFVGDTVTEGADVVERIAFF